MHGAAVCVSQDLIDIFEEHRPEEGMFIPNHGTESGLDRPGLCLWLRFPDADIEIERA